MATGGGIWTGHQGLSELREKDPEKYQETMKRIHRESAKRDRLLAVAIAVITFVVAYAIVATFFYIPAQLNSALVFWRALPGAALSVFLATTAMKYVKRWVYRSYFIKFPDGTDNQLKQFTRATRFVSLCRATILVMCSFTYSFLALGK